MLWKVIVLGDTSIIKYTLILYIAPLGVGKSSLVSLISEGEVLTNPTSTVGCSVEVKVPHPLLTTPTLFYCFSYMSLQDLYHQFQPVSL